MANQAEIQRKYEILATAQKILFEKNTVKISLTEIAKELGITHVALYRHFKNKDDLWFSLAKHWLITTENDLNKIATSPAANPVGQLHVWLTALTKAKQVTYQQHSALFSLYTDMVRTHPELEAQHLQVLQIQILSIFKIKQPNENDLAISQAVLDAFTFFYDPRYKEHWSNPKINIRQENMWQLISPAIKKWEN
ncbi:TetR/AcrR family transcriptional regulator [Oenococcus sp. UCMA 17063]|nr:TetR/AcrR family transcriptional regulator [Oenococcus sp. UCMA 17063]